MGGLRMAKASQEDINKLRTWLQFNDELCKIDAENEYEWGRLKEDWEDEDDFQKIIKYCENEGGFSWESYMDYYRSYISHIHMRIILGFEILLDNCCDSELDYLEFNQDIKQALEKFEK